jgi:hypothetical protein
MAFTTDPPQREEPDLPTMQHVLGYLYQCARWLVHDAEYGRPLGSDIEHLRAGIAAYERIEREQRAEFDTQARA